MTLVSGDMTSDEMTFGRLDRKSLHQANAVHTDYTVAAGLIG